MKQRFHLLIFALILTITADAQFVTYNWNGATFEASNNQARRYTIGRVYYNGAQWGIYGNIKLKIGSYYFKSAYLEYLVQANASANGINDAALVCTMANGEISNSVRIQLGDQTNAGNAYGGGINYYRDIYLDADYYSRWFIEAEVTGGKFAYDKYAIDSLEYGTITLFTAPPVQNISSFLTEQKTITIPTDHAVLYIKDKIGIGTVSPSDKLEVHGVDVGIGIKGTDRSRVNLWTTNYYGWQIEVNNANGNQSAGDLGFTESGVAGGRLVLKRGGNVGIGTTSPSEKLSVNGNIRAKKLIISQSNWPDYVFSAEYKPQNLTQVAQFIKANKHLPGVPSAEEITNKGLDVGETQAVLLKKIEELTLYVIELKYENRELRKEMNEVKKRITVKIDKDKL